ncbi:MAG: hypothetical protein DMG40_02595 [Acidobacteria bacterium]|nr:MAG: hypothetical protein DMG40_02595 [Acidobacteriota bacterium]
MGTNSALRCPLLKSKMRTVFMMVTNVLGGQALQMAFIQRNNVVRISRCSLHPTGDSSLGKVKTEHAEFPMDPRRSAGWVLNDHTKD